MKRNLKTFILFCIMLMGIQFAEIQAEAAITSIAEGSYTLKNVGTDKYLNVYGNKNANNTNIDVYSKDNTNGQDFKIYKYGESYALNPLCSSTGRVVNVYAENAKSGNNVCLWDRTNHSTQLWKFDKVDGGYVIRCANNTSCVLNATGSKNNANVNITTYKSGNKNQIWVLESPATTTNPATTTQKSTTTTTTEKVTTEKATTTEKSTTTTKTEKETTNTVSNITNTVNEKVDQGVKKTSQLKISGYNYPTTIYVGNAFTIKGKLTSNYNITSVTGEIIKVGATKATYKKTVTPNKSSYSLKNSKIDTSLLFDKLSKGEYYYKITATDAIGNTLTLVDKKFKVSVITFIWPVEAGKVTQEYGKKSDYNKKHRGIDISQSGSIDIYAAEDGTVLTAVKGKKNNRKAKDMESYGNYVTIQHDNGYVTLYAHLKSVNVKAGDKVKAGQVIGRMGNSGNSTGQHLHFEVIAGKKFSSKHKDPSKFEYITKKGKTIKGKSIKLNFSAN